MIDSLKFLLPPLAALHKEGRYTFEEVYELINENQSPHEAAEILGQLIRENFENNVESYLETLKLFREIEFTIRRSLWPPEREAPHHFSKALKAKESTSVLEQKLILTILATCADPTGLNLRNVLSHGFSIDPSLAHPILVGIKNKLLEKIQFRKFEDFLFENETKILKYHLDKTDITDFSLKGYEAVKSSKFIYNEENDGRLQVLERSYKLFDKNKYDDALLLLFPIMEQSIRLFAVKTLGLDDAKKCASSSEHFLAIKDSLTAFDSNLSNYINDILFHPEGPRIRDRLMHFTSPVFTREIAFLAFELFERLCAACDDSIIKKWNFVYHPSRILEYEIYNCSGTRINLDLFQYYCSQTYLRLIDGVRIATNAKNSSFKDSNINEFIHGPFQNLVCIFAVSIATSKNVKDTTMTHFLTICNSATKFANLGDSARFTSSLVDTSVFMSRHCKLIEKPLDFDKLVKLSQLNIATYNPNPK